MKKLYNLLAIIVFLFIIFSIPVATKLAENKDYSFYENRNLATVPEYSTKEFLNGSYLPKWETYLSDHIAFRDEMIYAYTYLNANVFKKSRLSSGASSKVSSAIRNFSTISFFKNSISPASSLKTSW